ncbi:MAG: hypothetical protein ABFR19_10425, partial [Pseudomonadota bacterium]
MKRRVYTSASQLQRMFVATGSLKIESDNLCGCSVAPGEGQEKIEEHSNEVNSAERNSSKDLVSPKLTIKLQLKSL